MKPVSAAAKAKTKAARKDNKWPWKDIMPKEGEDTTKQFEGKTYHVNCPHHPNQWVCHAPEDCTKNPSNAAAATPPPTADPASNTQSRRLTAARLAAALLESEGNPDDPEDGDDF